MEVTPAETKALFRAESLSPGGVRLCNFNQHGSMVWEWFKEEYLEDRQGRRYVLLRDLSSPDDITGMNCRILVKGEVVTLTYIYEGQVDQSGTIMKVHWNNQDLSSAVVMNVGLDPMEKQ